MLKLSLILNNNNMKKQFPDYFATSKYDFRDSAVTFISVNGNKVIVPFEVIKLTYDAYNNEMKSRERWDAFKKQLGAAILCDKIYKIVHYTDESSHEVSIKKMHMDDVYIVTHCDIPNYFNTLSASSVRDISENTFKSNGHLYRVELRQDNFKFNV